METGTVISSKFWSNVTEQGNIFCFRHEELDHVVLSKREEVKKGNFIISC
jgi:hypothetical protein